MQTLKKFAGYPKSLLIGAWQAFDIRDFFILCGLGLIGYGLWLFKPWVGFSVSGFLMMVIGYLMRGEK